MNYDAVVNSAIRHFPHAREFQRLFPHAEHTIVESKRDLYPDGWKPVHEWISRARFYDRYSFWLVVAIQIDESGVISEIEKPELYLAEVEKVSDEQSKSSWELSIAQFEDGDWEELVEKDGDFTAVGLDLKTDAPVDNFGSYWSNTRPVRNAVQPDSVALRAPFRFMTRPDEL